MDIKIKIIKFFADLLLPLIIGYCLSKTNIEKEKMDKLLTVNIFILYPILGILSFWIMKFELSLIWLPILGLIIPILSGALGYYRGKQKFNNPIDIGSYTISTMLSNRGTIGSVVAFILLGEIAYAYSQLTLLFNNVLLFMVCFPIAGYFRQKKHDLCTQEFSLKKVILSKNQIPIIGILIGIVLNLSGIERPAVFEDIFSVMIHMIAWFALLPLGMSIDFSEMKKYKKHVFGVSILKFILMPLLAVIGAKIFINNELAVKTVLIQFSTPAAINSVMTIKVHDLNVHLSMMIFIATTAIYLIAVFPIVLVIVQFIG